MSVLKPDDSISVYDNLYAKPTQLGLPSNAHVSMAIIFSISGCLYCGQYNFTTGYWTTIPGGETCRSFPDRDVDYWFYPPFTPAVFKHYADDVEGGRCRDEISRLHPFILTDDKIDPALL